MTSDKLQVAENKKQGIFVLSLATCCLLLLLSGCGFQLRGAGTYKLPDSLATLRVIVQGSQSVNDPLRLAMEDVLRTQAGGTVVQTGDVPLLILSTENIDNQVLTVDTSGKVNAYLVRYELGFNVVDAAAEPLLPPQTLRLQRDYRFNPLNVLAKEQEEETLRRELRRDALSQIVRRLARLTPPKKDADQR